jgi:serine/threonine protein phosphatase PrpC
MIAVMRTSTGHVRKNNEDMTLVREPDFYAIADGMGGADAGEVASFEAVNQLKRLDFSGLKKSEILPFLERSIQNINRKVWELSQQKENLSGMGTTLTALYLPDRTKAFVGHVGDSRVYVWQDGVLRQLTSDHSYVAELVRQKQITQAEADLSDQKHVITRAIGAAPTVEVDTFEILLGGVQKILLCSDGLTNMISETEIARIMGDSNLERLADGLMNAAMTAGGDDNISFIIIDLEAAEWKKE